MLESKAYSRYFKGEFMLRIHPLTYLATRKLLGVPENGVSPNGHSNKSNDDKPLNLVNLVIRYFLKTINLL
jgi:hypothetical protein